MEPPDGFDAVLHVRLQIVAVLAKAQTAEFARPTAITTTRDTVMS